MVAEDAQVLAYRGRPGSGRMARSPTEVRALLAAQPSRQRAARPGRRLRRAGRRRPARRWPASGRRPPTRWPSELRDDHIRVREAGGQRVRRQIAVRAQKPADVLGVYVYLPGRLEVRVVTDVRLA